MDGIVEGGVTSEPKRLMSIVAAWHSPHPSNDVNAGYMLCLCLATVRMTPTGWKSTTTQWQRRRHLVARQTYAKWNGDTLRRYLTASNHLANKRNSPHRRV